MSKQDSMKPALHQPRNEEFFWELQLYEAAIHNQVSISNKLIFKWKLFLISP